MLIQSTTLFDGDICPCVFYVDVGLRWQMLSENHLFLPIIQNNLYISASYRLKYTEAEVNLIFQIIETQPFSGIPPRGRLLAKKYHHKNECMHRPFVSIFERHQLWIVENVSVPFEWTLYNILRQIRFWLGTNREAWCVHMHSDPSNPASPFSSRMILFWVVRE